ncbi:hypothetical protein QWY97_18025 [Vibrio cortegadensis]|uniref:hypothetical protein n=1 Tax=Vibrio cortegadensis TaxID=1328770 RepID=UPI0021C3FF87|nr:hypothetical protein [Vibrio cortegadensis]MDN3699225.1 hypothetical protein [Vibrio cortegadensis]
MIDHLGEVVDKWTDIREVSLIAAPCTMLEMLEICRGLEDKGLLEINRIHETWVRLNGTGRVKALELQKQNVENN